MSDGKLVILHGLPRSGKDTFAKVLRTEAERQNVTCKIFAFGDELRRHLEILNPIVGMLDGTEGYAGLCGDPIPSTITWNEAIEFFGYEKAKDKFPEMRRLMRVYGTEIVRDIFDQNYWVNFVRTGAEKFFESENFGCPVAVITDGRFFNEVLNFSRDMWPERRDFLDLEATFITILRGNTVASEHRSDIAIDPAQVRKHDFDTITILNDRGIDEYVQSCTSVALALLK